MIVYMDGGSQKHSHNGRLFMLSWGAVVHHNDTTTELHGCKTHAHERFQGCHERVAFIEAVRHIMQHEVSPSDVSFYTDDSSVCDVNLFCIRVGKVDKEHPTVQRIKKLCDEYYDEETYVACLMHLLNSRFTKVKGHKNTIYNLRCDELSCHARRHALGNMTPLLSFEEWLHDGFQFYNRKQELETWYAPFSNMHPELITE